jgi:ribosomal protein S18 acetylase RimI-like enzyme
MENIIEINDSKIITDVLNKAFMTVALQYDLTKENAPRHPAFICSDVIERQFNRGFKMYGYAVNNQIVGCVGYWSDNNKIYHVERLAVLLEYRHQGIGKKLMFFIENKIIKNGGEIAEIHVMDKNSILIAWYKELGYIELRIEELKQFPFNSCIMNKTLIQV